MVSSLTRLTTSFAVQAAVVTADDCITPNGDWLKCITTAGEYQLPEGTFILDRHFQMPDGVTIRGAGPGKTIIEAARAVDNGCGSKIAEDQHPGDPTKRIGFVLGNNCSIGGFTFLALDDHRWQDYAGAALCGGAVFETPGCADAYCEGENIGDESHGDKGVENISIENVVISGKTSETAPQLAVFITQTKDLNNPTHGVRIKGIRMDHSWCDGINLHGATYDAIVEDCDLSFQGDDNLAVWSKDALADNIIFRNNILSQAKTTNLPSPRWGNCVALYGGGHITVQNTTCYHSSDAAVKMSEDFLGSWGDNSKVEVENVITDEETPACTDGGPSVVSGCEDRIKSPDSLPDWTQLAGHNCFEDAGATVVPPDAYAPDEGITLVACMAACASSVVPCDAVVTSVEGGDCFLRAITDVKACEEDSAFDVWLAPGGEEPPPPSPPTPSTDPNVPEEPVDPSEPVEPVPDMPADPEEPVDPLEPVEPLPDMPVDPDEPVDPAEPVEPVPDMPVDPEEPVDPLEPVEPVPDMPVDPEEPVDPLEPVEPVPGMPAYPEEPVDPLQPVTPVPDMPAPDTPNPFKPVEPVDPDPFAPVEPVDPAPVPTSCSLLDHKDDCEGSGCTWCRLLFRYKFCGEPDTDCNAREGSSVLVAV